MSAGQEARTILVGVATYTGVPNESWICVTEGLLKLHPVLGRPADLLAWIRESWDAVWSTRVGDGRLSIPFREIEPRAQIVGEFFENLLAMRLAEVGPWRRGSSREKDLIYGGEHPAGLSLDFEIKTSGQPTGHIYGNRSYAQPGQDGEVDSPTRKKRSGFFLCVNFWGDAIYHVRVGWIDPSDWEPQQSPTGQMAGLKRYVYEFKLKSLHGDYSLLAPLFVLDGIGAKAAESMAAIGISNVGGLVSLLRSEYGDGECAPPASDRIRAALLKRELDARTAARVAAGLADCTYLRAAWIVGR